MLPTEIKQYLMPAVRISLFNWRLIRSMPARNEPRAPEAPGKQPLGNRRQRNERAVWTKRPVSGEHMHVSVKVREVPESLHK